MLTQGTKLGPYEVVAPLGAGGMGEVYRARDTRLGRDVAIKVLPAHLAENPSRKQRLEREAKAISGLNHPHICVLYDIGHQDGTDFLVMEYLEGQTLAERLGRGPLPLPELLRIATEVADALEQAHRRSIIHRDLKPANIMLTPRGGAKLMDFGLAKPARQFMPGSSAGEDENAATASMAITGEGSIVGTLNYMAPEQLEGKEADARSDLFAFGAVLYEMATGKRAFEGEKATATMVAILERDPAPITQLQPTTPPALERLVNTCLAKSPDERFQSAHDVGLALKWISVEAGLPRQIESGGVKPPLQRALPWLVAASLALIVGLAAGSWVTARRSSSVPNWSAQMLGGPSISMGPRISPDGHTLAFQAMIDGLTQVAVMDTESGDWTVLTKNRTRGYVTELAWSSDGSEIYFDRQFSVPHGIYKVSRFGGDERLVLENAIGPEGLRDGNLLVVRVNKERNFQLYQFWPDSGRVDALDAFFPPRDLCPPVRVFRDGKDVVFFGRTREQAESDASHHLYVLNLASGKTRRLAPELDLQQYPASIGLFPVAVSSDDHSVLVDLKAGDLNRIISIPRSGTGPARTLLTMTLPAFFMDVDRDGNLYLDQADHPIEILRFSAFGGTPELLASSESPSHGMPATVPLPDGRVVMASLVAGRSRLLAAVPGAEATPFIQTKEETSFPVSRIGHDEIAFLLGPLGREVIALASMADGRIVRRLAGVSGSQVTDLAASPDGKTLYYAASQTVWAVSKTGGQPRRIGPGDFLAADPDGKELIVQLGEEEGIRLLRVAVSGGAEEPIPFLSNLRLTPYALSPNAIAKDGRVLLTVASPDSWFYGAGILDPRSGKLTRIPLNFSGDLIVPGWQDDGRILSSGWPLKVTLWRFRPAASGDK